jgi:hypothetical protein
MVGLKMKKHLEIIKGFGSFLLLFMLVSAVAVGTPEVTVKIVETVTIESTNSGDNGNGGDTIPTESPDSEDSGANGDLNPDVEPTDFQPDESTYDDEWVELFLSMIDADPFVMFGDFPELDAIANFE